MFAAPGRPPHDAASNDLQQFIVPYVPHTGGWHGNVTLLYAQKAEAEHAKLYQDALENLGKNADLPLYVCKVCGYTLTKLPDKNCASCREPASNYDLIK